MSARRLVILLLVATVGIGVGAGYAATLSVGTWHVWSGSQTLTKGTCTLTGSSAVADTDGNQASPNSNYGSVNTMRAKAGGNDRWAFVGFNLSSCAIPTTGGADSATLKLVITNAPTSNRTLTVAPVTSSWSQSTLTWNSAQSLSYGSATTTFTTGTSDNVTVNIPVTIDVDALIKNPTASYGWRIHDGGSGTATTVFATTDASSSTNRPRLVINYEK